MQQIVTKDCESKSTKLPAPAPVFSWRALLKLGRRRRDKTPSSRWRRLWIGIIGGTVLLFGVVLIVLPGPAFIVIPAGLAILATEFAWAGHWLRKMRLFLRLQRKKIKRRFKKA